MARYARKGENRSRETAIESPYKTQTRRPRYPVHMKLLVKVLVALLLFHAIVQTARSQSIPWGTSLEGGLAKARSTGKLALLEFHNPG